MTVTHFVPYDAPGRQKTFAICGAYVDRGRDHANQPTCPDCVRLRAELATLDPRDDDYQEAADGTIERVADVEAKPEPAPDEDYFDGF